MIRHCQGSPVIYKRACRWCVYCNTAILLDDYHNYVNHCLCDERWRPFFTFHILYISPAFLKSFMSAKNTCLWHCFIVESFMYHVKGIWCWFFADEHKISSHNVVPTMFYFDSWPSCRWSYTRFSSITWYSGACVCTRHIYLYLSLILTNTFLCHIN